MKADHTDIFEHLLQGMTTTAYRGSGINLSVTSRVSNDETGM